MRLGFNWPLGPLEFADLIGAKRAVELLEGLRQDLGDAYRAAPKLAAAAGRARVSAAPKPATARTRASRS